MSVFSIILTKAGLSLGTGFISSDELKNFADKISSATNEVNKEIEAEENQTSKV